MLDANISYRDVENLPCIKKEICDLSRRIALCEAGDITNASIAGNFTSSSSSIMFDKSITCKDIQNIPLFKKKICELKAKLAACMAGNANASPSPTPSITPSPSPSNAPRATLTLRGGVGTDGPAASTAQELCGTQPFSTVWANVIEVNRFMSEGHDPSVITVVYESNTGPTVVNGNDKWAYSPLSGDDPAVRRAFQVSPNGVLYNFTTINCPSPSPTASVSPSPTPSTTPSPTPTPSTSTLTSILILLRTGVSPANPVCTDSTPMESGFYISNNENVAYLADGNTAHITTVYTNDTLTTRFDGGNLWYHFSNGSTTNVFQLDSNGTLSNHTTIDCTPTASPTPSITPSPTPSITPTPSIIHSTEARRVVEFWGTPSDTPNNRVGASTASGVCSGYNSFYGWIRQSEYDQYIINGDPSFITIIYDWLDGNVTINGSDTWFYPAASTTSSTTKRTFQLGTNGIPYNFTTIICPSPSPSPTVTASTTPSPTPTPTISDSPSPTPSITTTPTPSITPTPTGTPTPSVTPSPTPSITPSPSVTVGLFLNGVLLTSNPAVAYTNPIDLAAGDNTLTQLGGGSYVLRSLISGTGGLTNNIGAANLITMDNVNSYSGGTKLASGMMATNRAGAFGSGGIALSGGNLRFNNAAFTTGVINMTNTILQVAGSTGLIDMIGSGTASNNLALNTGTTTISNNSTLKIMRSAGNYGSTTFSSAISGAGTLIVGDTNSGVTPNTAANNQGRLIFSNANAFATFTGNINVLQRGNITMAGGQLNGNNVNIAGGGYMTLNAGVTNTIGDLSGAGTITKVTVAATGTLRVNSGIFTGSISTSPISGNTAIALTKIGLGSFFIGGSGNYASGTNINGGTFSIGHNNAMGTGIVTLSPGTTLNKNGLNPPNIIVNNGGTVNP